MTNVKNTTAANHSADQVEHLLCSEIFVDYGWNCRIDVASGNPETETEEAGYEETYVSIAKDGMRQPVVVRPNPYKGKGGPGSKFPYMLVEGFTRFRCITELAAGERAALLGKCGMLQTEVDKLKTKSPTIRAFVVTMTEAEARKRNVGENALRSQLTAPDLLYGVVRMAETMPDASNEQLGMVIGRSGGYIAKLRRIASTFADTRVPADKLWQGSPEMPVLHAWRISMGKARYDQMLEIADVDQKTPMNSDEKLSKFLIASKIIKNPEAPPKKRAGAGAWAENACLDAKIFGGILGALAVKGVVEFGDEEEPISADEWALVAPKYASKGDVATEDNKDAIASACNVGIFEVLRAKRERKSVPTAPRSAPKAPTSSARTLGKNGTARA